MPWKLLLRLTGLAIILVFVVMNRQNTSDVSLGFRTFEDVPIFLSLFLAFFAGALVSIPVAVRSSARKNKSKTEKAIKRHEERKAVAEKRANRGRVRLPFGRDNKQHSAEQTGADGADGST